jgi:CubicO group peptidase (beta-lactamase class C family)
MSKSFTAMAVLKLRDEGKLQLDDPVEKYIPQMRDQVYPTTDAPLITIRHLLTHGAGFPEDNPWGDRQLADTDAEFMAFLKEGISFSNPPGVQYEYSNLGFALLGKLITEVSGKPYQQYIREEILKPLSMNITTWEYGDVAPDKLAHGYRWINQDWEEQALLHDAPDGSWGAMGSMISSVEEFSRYISFHLSAWPPSSLAEKGPVRRSSVREMQHPWRFNGLNPNYRYPGGRICAVSSAYGYGLRWLYDCEDRAMVSHSGGLPGFGSHWMILPDYGIGIVALANRTYAPMSSINMQAIDTLIRLASLKPKAIPISAILKQRQEQLLRLLPEWNGAESSGLFAENFFDDYKIDSLRKQTKELYQRAGTIKRVNEIIALNNLRGHFTIEGENASLQIFFTLSPEKEPLIQAFDIWEKREE